MKQFGLTSPGWIAQKPGGSPIITSINVCMYVCMYVYIYAYIYICMYVCMYECMYVCMHVCISVCLYLCLSVYITKQQLHSHRGRNFVKTDFQGSFTALVAPVENCSRSNFPKSFGFGAARLLADSRAFTTWGAVCGRSVGRGRFNGLSSERSPEAGS